MKKISTELWKIEWFMPYVLLSNSPKNKLLKFLEKDRPITISNRARELFEYPAANKHVWTVKNFESAGKTTFCRHRTTN